MEQKSGNIHGNPLFSSESNSGSFVAPNDGFDRKSRCNSVSSVSVFVNSRKETEKATTSSNSPLQSMWIRRLRPASPSQTEAFLPAQQEKGHSLSRYGVEPSTVKSCSNLPLYASGKDHLHIKNVDTNKATCVKLHNEDVVMEEARISQVGEMNADFMLQKTWHPHAVAEGPDALGLNTEFSGITNGNGKVRAHTKVACTDYGGVQRTSMSLGMMGETSSQAASPVAKLKASFAMHEDRISNLKAKTSLRDEVANEIEKTCAGMTDLVKTNQQGTRGELARNLVPVSFGLKTGSSVRLPCQTTEQPMIDGKHAAVSCKTGIRQSSGDSVAALRADHWGIGTPTLNSKILSHGSNMLLDNVMADGNNLLNAYALHVPKSGELSQCFGPLKYGEQWPGIERPQGLRPIRTPGFGPVISPSQSQAGGITRLEKDVLKTSSEHVVLPRNIDDQFGDVNVVFPSNSIAKDEMPQYSNTSITLSLPSDFLGELYSDDKAPYGHSNYNETEDVDVSSRKLGREDSSCTQSLEHHSVSSQEEDGMDDEASFPSNSGCLNPCQANSIEKEISKQHREDKMIMETGNDVLNMCSEHYKPGSAFHGRGCHAGMETWNRKDNISNNFLTMNDSWAQGNDGATNSARKSIFRSIVEDTYRYGEKNTSRVNVLSGAEGGDEAMQSCQNVQWLRRWHLPSNSLQLSRNLNDCDIGSRRTSSNLIAEPTTDRSIKKKDGKLESLPQRQEAVRSISQDHPARTLFTPSAAAMAMVGNQYFSCPLWQSEGVDMVQAPYSSECRKNPLESLKWKT